MDSLNEGCAAPTVRGGIASDLLWVWHFAGENEDCVAVYKPLDNYCWLQRVVPDSSAESRTAPGMKL